ncbi:MAG: glutamine synthetase family protein [Acidobacteriota bacterium]|jgi:glutamine synthetase|nr:glutamine synthetase family protein [Acidobacteriota bacterium]
MSSLIQRNPLVEFLGKSAKDFTKEDIKKYITDNGIEMVNFRHTGRDGRLKALNFYIGSEAQLDRILSVGERVDGSSLMDAIDAGSSDVYVIPRYSTAFVNPFSEIPALDILCHYYTNEGVLMPTASDTTLKKAADVLKKDTGYDFYALGELEYYVFGPKDEDGLFPAAEQRSYQEANPFTKWNDFRNEAMRLITQCGGDIKYGHSEVGAIHTDKYDLEQSEIEFNICPVMEAADQLIIAKWIMRSLAHQYGVNISFAPKIMVGHAGSGLHFHTMLVKNGKNAFVDNGGELSEAARKAIGGYLKFAQSLTAFGNTVPTSYLRLVPHQEAPTNVCWGERNRSGLVRVPLGWRNAGNMAADANGSEVAIPNFINPQTVEFRCPDGSANIYLSLAGLVNAARWGLLNGEESLEIAEKLAVKVNIFAKGSEGIQDRLPQLPQSCTASADFLERDRNYYIESGIFNSLLIDQIIRKLKDYDDGGLSETVFGKPEETAKIVEKYLFC